MFQCIGLVDKPQKKYSVYKDCSDLSLFKLIVCVNSKPFKHMYSDKIQELATVFIDFKNIFFSCRLEEC